MSTLIVDNRSTSLSHLVRLFENVGLQPQIIQLDELISDRIHTDDLVVLSGSHELTAAWNDDIFAQEIKLIKSHEGPLLGICLGMQLMAHTYGSSIHRLPKKRYGVAPITFLDSSHPLCANIYPEVFESHSWSVKKLTDPLIALAESGAGIEVLKHTSRPQYGLQFHPEAVDDINGKEIFESILKEIKPS